MGFSTEAYKLIKNATKGKKHVKFTIGVLKNNETSFTVFDSDGEIPYENFSYEIGSICKVFTTSLLAKYIHLGKIDLEDSLHKYFPELAQSKYYPTIKRLATHTSGYSALYPVTLSDVFFRLMPKQLWNNFITKKKADMVGSEFMVMDLSKMINLINKPNLKDKDYNYKYSNFGIAVLGQAISLVAKKEYAVLMNEYLLQDLHMENSYIGTKSDNAILGYDSNNIAYNPLENPMKNEKNLMIPSGGITSTAKDLLHFAKMNIDRAHDYFRLTQKVYSEEIEHYDGICQRTQKFKMGLGWFNDYQNPSVYFHEGHIDGFSTVLAFDKEKQTAVVLLMNYHIYKQRDELWREILRT